MIINKYYNYGTSGNSALLTSTDSLALPHWLYNNTDTFDNQKAKPLRECWVVTRKTRCDTAIHSATESIYKHCMCHIVCSLTRLINDLLTINTFFHSFFLLSPKTWHNTLFRYFHFIYKHNRTLFRHQNHLQWNYLPSVPQNQEQVHLFDLVICALMCNNHRGRNQWKAIEQECQTHFSLWSHTAQFDLSWARRVKPLHNTP